jgi:hypothetical protein
MTPTARTRLDEDGMLLVRNESCNRPTSTVAAGNVQHARPQSIEGRKEAATAAANHGNHCTGSDARTSSM